MVSGEILNLNQLSLLVRASRIPRSKNGNSTLRKYKFLAKKNYPVLKIEILRSQNANFALKDYSKETAQNSVHRKCKCRTQNCSGTVNRIPRNFAFR